MVNVLLDTCVVSEIRRQRGEPRVRQAVESLESDQIFLSVVTIGEIANGITRASSMEQRRALMAWLGDLELAHRKQILSIDIETARIWGEITGRARASGVTIPVSDGLIAATALRHGLHVMTRNDRHFEATGALVIDPWI